MKSKVSRAIFMLAIAALAIVLLLLWWKGQKLFVTRCPKFSPPKGYMKQLVTDEERRGPPSTIEVRVENFQSHMPIAGANLTVTEPGICSMEMPGSVCPSECYPKHRDQVRGVTSGSGVVVLQVPSVKYSVSNCTASGFLHFEAGATYQAKGESLTLHQEHTNAVQKHKTVTVLLLPEGMVTITTANQAVDVVEKTTDVQGWLRRHPEAQPKIMRWSEGSWQVQYVDTSLRAGHVAACTYFVNAFDGTVKPNGGPCADLP